MEDVQIRIEAYDLPGRHNREHRDIFVGVQRRGDSADILDAVPADTAEVRWQFDVTAVATDAAIDLRGPYVQGRPGDRFIYLSWGTWVDEKFAMFGRSKLLLSAVDHGTLAAAIECGLLTGRVGLVDARGRVRLAAVKPPAIDWSAG